MKKLIAQKSKKIINLKLILAIVFLPHIKSTAQNPTVVADSLVVMNRVYAKERLVVDKLAIFKEDVRIDGSTRIKTDLRVDSILRVDGTARLNGNVRMNNLGTLSSINDSTQILVVLPNGQLKKHDLINLYLSAFEPPAELDLCGASSGLGHWWSGYQKLFTGCPNTNVGIGVNDPLFKLDVRGISFSNRFLAGNIDGTTDALINVIATNHSDNLAYFGVKSIGQLQKDRLRITNSGSVFIYNNDGPALVVYNSGSNKILQLENNGLLRTREIKVDEQSWPDYVFDKNYKLPKLKDVAKFIEKNHHLPGVPSAAEIESDGLNLGDMQKIQMQKIEELTLYLIQLEKRIELLEVENKELKNQK